MAEPQTLESRHHALDLVRGIAALCVAVYHFMAWDLRVTVQSLGTFSVYIFFILSGTTMMMVYGERFSERILNYDLKQFFINRIARLFPLLAAVAVFTVVYRWIGGTAPTPSDFVRSALTATGLMGLHQPGWISNAPGAWSLGIEAVFYVAFPIAAMLLHRASLKSALVALAILVLAQHGLFYLLRANEFSDLVFWASYTSVLTFAPFFLIGMLCVRAEQSRAEQSRAEECG